MKVIKYLAMFAGILFLVCAILFAFSNSEILAVCGVGAGLILGGCFFTAMVINSRSPFWSDDDEDFDEHKIYEE